VDNGVIEDMAAEIYLNADIVLLGPPEVGKHILQ
jgi:stage III sporulation protein SpoIIIAA